MPPRPRRPPSAATGSAGPGPARADSGPGVSPDDGPAPDAVALGPTPQDVGRAVRRLRSARGYAQEEFADRCGVHRTGLSALERGLTDARLSTLARIAAGLGLPVSELLREVEREAGEPSAG